jgi:hypothetical protein
MVSDVQGWLDDILANFGWILKNDSESIPTTFRAFYTREGAIEQGVPQFAPELIVSFVTPATVPEPSAIVLLGSALIGFGALRRRRTSGIAPGDCRKLDLSRFAIDSPMEKAESAAPGPL